MKNTYTIEISTWSDITPRQDGTYDIANYQERSLSVVGYTEAIATARDERGRMQKGCVLLRGPYPSMRGRLITAAKRA